MRIDLDQLVTFERIVREGSFSGAAWALDIPQPTVSARVKALEQAVGGPLFHRQGRTVALTDLGQTFLPYARRTIAVLMEGVEMSRQSRLGEQGRVTFGGLSSMGGALVGSAVAQFYAAHPQVELFVRGSDHEGVVDLLRDRIVELGLLCWPCPESVLTPMEPLLRLREEVTLAVGPDHPFARVASISYDELIAAGHPFLSLRWWKVMHPAIDEIAARAPSSITLAMESARHMVRSGIGLGFFTQVYIADDIASGALVPVSIRDFIPIHRDIALVRLPRDTPLSAAAVAFVERLSDQAVRLGIRVLPLSP